jgi:photosystem II stability/assembly factor-like uncharacterized protein
MRGRSWRRAIAVLAVLVGFGVGASTVPAAAATPHTIVRSADWWW